MMINPTRKQKEIYEMFDKEIAPYWLTFDESNHRKLKDDAPEDIKKKYELFKKSGTQFRFHND